MHWNHVSSADVSSTLAADASAISGEVTVKLRPFDKREYRDLIHARENTIRGVLQRIKPGLGLRTALDAGAGVGFFSQTLRDGGLKVQGFDGREENVAEARRRFPSIPFEQGDVQKSAILELGKFDLVLCFGLLYHLENPLLALRHLRGLTEKCLLLESMCVPDDRPSLLLREEPREDDQSLTDIAYYPSESSLVKMLYRVGFAYVYRLAPLPDHDDFYDTREHRRKRTVLIASASAIDLFGFRLCLENHESQDPWSKAAQPKSISQRMERFLRQPGRKKYFTLANRVRRTFPDVPIPWRLPFGAWWLAQSGELDRKLVNEGFEGKELHFVENFLRPGMTVLDIGAHHGLYSLLSSKCIGRKGQVIAFEASPRECRRLGQHVRVNGCANVRIEPCAAGGQAGTADLFVVDGACDWGNSLRAPAVSESTYRVRVEVRTVDDVLDGLGISRVDFIKLDVEGAELSVLHGASRLLSGASRPAILVEVQDLRTTPWGYRARDIVQFLTSLGYRWYALAPDSSLHVISSELDSYEANLVAFPCERAREFRSLVERRHLPVLHRSRPLSARRQGVQLLKSMLRVRQG
ncbi:MAG: FkbM family methyltransferase [Acidobacteriota bacterium]|nr:FkbM family methyltransferase [Acidobacteriota bacterium]